MNDRRRFALALAGIAAATFGLTLFGSDLNRLFMVLPGIDKVLHVAFHAVLFMVLRALAARIWDSPRVQVQAAVIAGLLLAVSDELLQGTAPSRTVEAGDVIADLCGVVLGWTLSTRSRRAPVLGAAGVALAAAFYVTYDTHVRLIDYSRALRYERAHDFVRAREHYHRAVASGLRTPAVYNGLAWVEVESGRGDAQAAVNYARLALNEEPQNADFLDTYGWALHHAGRSAEALQPLQKALAKKPTMFCIHYHLGAVYRALGRRDLAELHFLRQLEWPGTREAAFAARDLSQLNALR